ncbi:MAG TPA: hypothetical protein PLV59_03570 [Candidatus Dojkabacteria bacterium]|nr:hypothetical protein [Candidatus Dojkabacteria bacterium]
MTKFEADNSQFRIALYGDSDLDPYNDQLLSEALRLKMIDPKVDFWLADIEVFEKRQGIGEKVISVYEEKAIDSRRYLKNSGINSFRIVGIVKADFEELDGVVSWYAKMGYAIKPKSEYIFVEKTLEL